MVARPLRIEFSGALYHITARGNAKKNIFKDSQDRKTFLEYFSNVIERHHWLCHAFCLMDNHYHLLIEVQCPTLKKGMRDLNGSYSQAYNRRHSRVGHLFQGRYKAIIVQKESYLLELSRYIVLNPVRARMVHSAEEWPWSSYRATVGLEPPPDYLTTDWILSAFGRKRGVAFQGYKKFVCAGKNQPSPWEKLKNQIYLGSDEFIENMQSKIDPEQKLDDIPKHQKQSPPKPLNFYKLKYQNRNQAMAEAYKSGHYTLKAIGDYFSVGKSTVSRAFREFFG